MPAQPTKGLGESRVGVRDADLALLLIQSNHAMRPSPGHVDACARRDNERQEKQWNEVGASQAGSNVADGDEREEAENPDAGSHPASGRPRVASFLCALLAQRKLDADFLADAVAKTQHQV